MKKFFKKILLTAALVLSIPLLASAATSIPWLSTPLPNGAYLSQTGYQGIIGANATTSTQRFEVHSALPLSGSALFQHNPGIGDVSGLTFGEDSGLLSTFAGGENPFYSIYAFSNLGSFKVFSAVGYEDGTVVSAASYSKVLSWPSVTGATGYRIFRDRNTTGTYTECADVKTTSTYDSDYTPHAQSVVWRSCSLAVDAIPTSFSLETFANVASTSLTYGLSTNGTGYIGDMLGIGTSSPSSLLSIGNTQGINFRTATSSFSTTGGIDLKSGCFSINSTCITGGASLSGGATNALTYWTSPTTVGATSSPTVGYITSTTTATSTFAGGINITSGCLQYQGGCLSTTTLSNTSLTVGHPVLVPADATNYYFGQRISTAPGTVAGAGLNTAVDAIPVSGTIRAVSCEWGITVTLASNENVIYNFILYNSSGAFISTTTISSTVQLTTGAGNFTNPNLGIAVTAGQQYLIEMKAPTWATNPSALYQKCTINIDSTGSVSGGTIQTGTTGQTPYYAANGTALTATSSLFLSTAGNIGINNVSPTLGQLQIQGSTANSGKTLTLTGYSADATSDSAGGISLVLTHNASGNRQFTIFDSDAVGNANQWGFRFAPYTGGASNKFPIIDAVNGTAASVGNFSIGQSGSNVGIGFDAGGNQTDIKSHLSVNGNTSIGSGYVTSAAPTNGLIVQGNVGIGTTTPDSNLDVRGNFRLEGSSAFTTASISGAIIGIGCDTTTTAVDASVSSTTVFVTTPQTFPGPGLFWQSYLSAAGVVTTEVCSDVTVTPTASTYNVRIIK